MATKGRRKVELAAPPPGSRPGSPQGGRPSTLFSRMLGQDNERCNDQRPRVGLPPACGPSVTSAFPTARPSRGKGSQSWQLPRVSEGPGERGVEAAGLQVTVALDGLGYKAGRGQEETGEEGGRERREAAKHSAGWDPPSAPVSPRPPQAQRAGRPRVWGLSPPRLGLSEHQRPHSPIGQGTSPRRRCRHRSISTPGKGQRLCSKCYHACWPPRGRGPRPAPRGTPGAPVRVQQRGLGVPDSSSTLGGSLLLSDGREAIGGGSVPHTPLRPPTLSVTRGGGRDGRQGQTARRQGGQAGSAQRRAWPW